MKTEYGTKRLLTYADTFREVARTMEGEFWVDTESRDGILQARRSWESRQILCANLEQAARIMTRAAAEAFQMRSFDRRRKRILTRWLKAEGICLKELYYIERPGERKAVGMTLERMRGERFGLSGQEQDISLAAGFLSVLLDKRMEPSVNCPHKITERCRDYVFVEEASYLVLSGTARAVKEGEVQSGDNFALTEAERGRMTALLCDGMGSGQKACEDSEMVLDLMEKLLESGYPVEEAVEMVNGSLVAGAERSNMSTLDLCDLDLYEGRALFLKMGAAASFVKKGNRVEIVANHSLPLGIFQQTEPEVREVELEDDTYVIMMTDGCLEALKREQYEETMKQKLRQITDKNPQQIAEEILRYVLEQSGGAIADDMTVLVLGIWEIMKRET